MQSLVHNMIVRALIKSEVLLDLLSPMLALPHLALLGLPATLDSLESCPNRV